MSRDLSPRRFQAGFTIVELLIVAGIMVTLLAGLGAFFALQSRVGERTQDRNEVENKVREVAEIVMQDVQQAGSVATYIDGVSNYAAAQLGANCSRSVRSGCVVTTGGGNVVTTLYLTSLVRPAGGSWSAGGAAACRRVDYDITDEIFSRRDVSCSDTPSSFDGYDFASGIQDVQVQFTCNLEGDPFTNPTLCYDAGSYPREALIRVVGVSENSREPFTTTVELSTPVPNLRPPVDFSSEPLEPPESP